MTIFDDFSRKVLLILATLIFMRNSNFMLSKFEHEQRFITSGLSTHIFLSVQSDSTDPDPMSP